MPQYVKETPLTQLKAKLREMFELEKSELDFGIYRIRSACNERINAFLDHEIEEVVRSKLATFRSGEAGAGIAPGELEADIYAHLLAFFGRYYSKGEFISRRRYDGDGYAIPYAGEEILLHWANKDQYYVKSGESNKDYRFVVDGGDSAASELKSERTVRFKLVNAASHINHQNESDSAKRRYILVERDPVEITEAELTFRFEHRQPTESEKQRATRGVVSISGGAIVKSAKADERERFCADAERRALQVVPPVWRKLLETPVPTNSRPSRTRLGKHLDIFTQGNASDFFIHKDLGLFLRRELDFYLKNEVVRLVDLESQPPHHLINVHAKVQAIRAVADQVIGFLASIENLQRTLWLKKKLVLETNWLVTVDRISEAQRDTVAANTAQWKAWEQLGFKPTETEPHAAKWGTREYLDRFDKLVVDTALYARSFAADVLARFDAAQLEPLGCLIHSDNFQALRLLQPTLARQVQCVYIDPPYNANTAGIAYKNGYRHSSWASLIHDRLVISATISSGDGSHVVAIDENEQETLGGILSQVFPNHERICVSVIHNKKGIQGRYFSHNHESTYFCIPPLLKETNSRAIDKQAWEFDNLRKWGRESRRETARNCFYPIFVSGGAIVGFGTVSDPEFHPGSANVSEGGRIAVYPVDVEKIERKWRYARDSVEGILPLLKVKKLSTGEVQIVKARATKALKTVWDDSRYIAGDYGTKWLTQMGLKIDTDLFPKSVHVVEDAIFAVTHPQAIVLDYFAGSGTTGHAVINLNREGNRRRFVLVEMGAYFHTVLKPRITKALYSPNWKDGKAQTHGAGVSALVKYFSLESYADVLSNLPRLPADSPDKAATSEPPMNGSLDSVLGKILLPTEAFRDPWGYAISAHSAGEPQARTHSVDLIETFNHLLGLKVTRYGPIERYHADFEQAEPSCRPEDLKTNVLLRPDIAEDYVFQHIQGELNDGHATRILIIWRKLAGQVSSDAMAKYDAVLRAWLTPHRETTRDRPYRRIYLNGPLPHATSESETFYPIEEEFCRRMFLEP